MYLIMEDVQLREVIFFCNGNIPCVVAKGEEDNEGDESSVLMLDTKDSRSVDRNHVEAKCRYGWWLHEYIHISSLSLFIAHKIL